MISNLSSKAQKVSISLLDSSLSSHKHKQVQGPKGWTQIKTRLQEEGVSSLYQGAVIQAVATFVGHWPFFVTFNYLSSVIPLPPADAVFPRLGRNAFLGKHKFQKMYIA